jgi:hemerythrin
MQKESAKNDGSLSLLEHNLFIVWKPEYNLGIPIIDEQHHGIVTTINSLFYAMQNKHGEDVLKPVISMVTEYTHIHFDVEEEFLRKYGFTDFEKHRELHNELRRTLSSVESKSLRERNPQEFLEFLKNWWIDHICKKDRIFRDELKLSPPR